MILTCYFLLITTIVEWVLSFPLLSILFILEEILRISFSPPRFRSLTIANNSGIGVYSFPCSKPSTLVNDDKLTSLAFLC